MSNYSYGFLGCGNMGGALIKAASKVVPAERILICDTDKQKVDAFVADGKATAADAKTLAKTCDYLFLAVKPNGLSALFDQIRPVLAERSGNVVLVSMAAGVTIETLEDYAKHPCAVIRMMPNTPVAVGEGMTVYDVNELTTDEHISGFLGVLSHAGRFDRVSESFIDAAGALSGCGPAFVYLFAEALADGGVACGLPRAKAQEYAAQTLLGAAKMMLRTGKHPGELKDAVCSPGGTTIEGVRVLEEKAFRAAAMDAVVAAYEKTLKMKK